MSWLSRNWFLVALGPVLGLAWLLPAPAGTAAWPGVVKMGLIALIFFLMGFSLRTRELGAGLTNWRLHGIVQGLSLVACPLLLWGLDQLWAAMGLAPGLRIGLLVLGALPTTVTSCVALAVAAGGNGAGALVNATIGNLLGVLLTPLWLVLMVGADGAIPVASVMTKLGLVVVLPVLLGQVAQAIAGHLRERWKPLLGKLPLVLLLGILFLAFNKAFAEGVAVSGWELLLVAVLCALVHGLLLAGSWYGAAGLPRADRISALFCASQKTLALGIPLIALCFPGDPRLPLIAAPVLIYHPLQLVVAGLLVPRMNKP